MDQLTEIAFLLIQIAGHILKDKVEGVRDIRLYRLVGPTSVQHRTPRLNGRDVPGHRRQRPLQVHLALAPPYEGLQIDHRRSRRDRLPWLHQHRETRALNSAPCEMYGPARTVQVIHRYHIA